MSAGEQAPQLERVLGLARILAYAFVAGISMLVVLACAMAGNAKRSPAGASDELCYALCGLSIACIVVAHFAAELARRRNTVASGRPYAAALMGFVTGLALREVPALCGFVLTILSGERVWAIKLGFVSIAAILASWPTRERFHSPGA